MMTVRFTPPNDLFRASHSALSQMVTRTEMMTYPCHTEWRSITMMIRSPPERQV